jgi:hypothetical protein
VSPPEAFGVLKQQLRRRKVHSNIVTAGSIWTAPADRQLHDQRVGWSADHVSIEIHIAACATAASVEEICNNM